MLHLQPAAAESPEPYAEAVARLASIRHALRLVDPFAGGPACDPSEDEAIGAAWNDAGEAKRRCFDQRTGRIIASTAEGLEALLAEQGEGREPNAAATRRIAEEIRVGLEDVSRLMLGTERDLRADPYPLAL